MTALPSADLSDAEALTLARIEAEPDAPESLRERVVTAMHQAVCDCGDSEHGIYFWAADMAAAADAALDVLRGPSTCTTCGQAQAAIGRVAALADDLEVTADSRRVLALDAEAAGASEEAEFLRDRADDERAQADSIRTALDGAR